MPERTARTGRRHFFLAYTSPELVFGVDRFDYRSRRVAEGDRYGREQIEVVGRSLLEEPEQRSLGVRRLQALRPPHGRSSTGNCHNYFAADLGLAEKRYCSQSLAENRKREPPRQRREQETSPCSETPWTKSSSFSILAHPTK